MASKFVPIRFAHYGLLLAAVALLITVSRATPLKSTHPKFETPRRITNTDLVETQSSSNYDGELRGISSMTKINNVAKVGTKKLKKVAEGVKTKLAPNKQSAVDTQFKEFVDKVQGDLFNNAQFADWVKFVFKVYNRNDEAAHAAMVTTMVAHYGDEYLASMLAATKGSNMITTFRLKEAQINSWKASGKTLVDVYKILHVDAEASDLLKSPTLKTWISYVVKLKENPYELLLLNLKTHYDDAALAQMFAVAKGDAATTALAGKMETLLLKKWQEKDKTMIDVFQLLKLNTKSPKELLVSPVLSTWMSYTLLLKKNPYELLFKAIKKTGIDDAGLARMVGTAEQIDSNTAFVAQKMQHQQFKIWKREGKSATDVFRLLGLKKEGDKLFESPVWSTWTGYLDRTDRTAVYKETILVLKTQFGDERLTNIISKAKDVDSTADTAEKLERSFWWAMGLTSDDLFNLLKLKHKGFESPDLQS
ncbi:hypothetical protein GN244_ATG15987 [Phytophthora infestans]|uniref:Secreted RxLR effector peptide protein n=1 Tax=Phytophthora infestans TaxID=4787 RepID=A0A833W7V3_PHYIN|nr:hypothetical protein GN244_ATG15987 [Phytophthora infestans]